MHKIWSCEYRFLVWKYKNQMKHVLHPGLQHEVISQNSSKYIFDHKNVQKKLGLLGRQRKKMLVVIK